MDTESTQKVLIILLLFVFGLSLMFCAQLIINKGPCGHDLDEETKQKYCKLLGIKTTATIGEARKAFKEKSKTVSQENYDELKQAYEKLALGVGNIRDKRNK